MFHLDLSEDDRKWLLNKYQGLSVTQENGIKILSGELDFWMSHEGVELSDTYQVRIELKPSTVSDLPTVIETGGRIKKVAEERNIPIIDLHTYSDGVACLCIRLAEPSYFPDRFSLPIFMEKLVEPFFYAQRYFEDYDTWPWNAYHHGVLGWLEWYYDQENMTPETASEFIEKLKTSRDWPVIRNELTKKRGVKGHHPCLCGRPLKFRKCHYFVFLGTRKLQQDVKEFHLLK